MELASANGLWRTRIRMGIPGIAVLWFAGTALAVPALPAINTDNVIVITNSPYNAVGDGVTTNTSAKMINR